MLTSYFSKSGRTYGAVSISRFPPKGYSGRQYLDLAPPKELLKIEDMEIYTKLYKEQVLARRDPQQVYEDLGEDAIILCFEKDRDQCHRKLVAEWLEENLGVKVPELIDSPREGTKQVTLF